MFLVNFYTIYNKSMEESEIFYEGTLPKLIFKDLISDYPENEYIL